MKKLFIFILFNSLLFYTDAQTGITGNLIWSISDSTLTISGSGTMPNYVDGHQPWNQYYSKINKLIVKEGVLNIGNYAFPINIRSLELPNSLIIIGDYAFTGCSFSKLTIPNNVFYIGNKAFVDCNNIKNISLNSGISFIGENPFDECDSLLSIEVDSNNKNYISENGVLYSKDKSKLISFPLSKTDFVIPETVKTIGASSVHGLKLNSIIIPNNVETIERLAFCGCRNITTLILPNSVKTLGEYAFSWCDNLTSITLGKNIISFGNYLFDGSLKLTEIISQISSPMSRFTLINYNANLFYNQCILKVPIGCKSNYEVLDPWNNFKNIIEYTPNKIDIIPQNSIHIYPNPTTGVVYLDTNTDFPSNSTVNLHGLAGDIPYNGNIQNKTLLFDLSNRNLKGIYMLVIRDIDGNLLMSKKIIFK